MSTLELVAGPMASGGDAVAILADGTTGFLPFVLPGERVRAHVTARRGNAVLAKAEAFLTVSPDRVQPPCQHFGECGGCVLQHWAPGAYRAWKRERLIEALHRAGFRDASVGPLACCPPRTRRRADLALRQGAGGVAIGFHGRGEARVVDMRECHVLDPRLFALVDPLRHLLARLRGFRREGSALLNLLDSGPDLLLRTDAPLTPGDRRLVAAFGASQGIPRIAWALGNGAPEIAAQGGPVHLSLAGTTVTPPPGAFLQATPEGEADIVAAVLAGLPDRMPAKARVADLYAGLGTLSLPLASRARVDAFEGDSAAAAALAVAANKAGGRVSARKRDLSRQPLRAAELAAYAAVVLDPPYAGAAEQCALLASSAVRRAILVSCNPVALARDAAAFAGKGWVVLAATPVDQFLWSPHLESVVVLDRGT